MPDRALTAAPSGVGTRSNLEVEEHSALALDMGTTAPQEKQTVVPGEATNVTKPPNGEAVEAEAAQDANPPGSTKNDAIK
jgi:molybdopterin biosynthesis enzyme